METESDWDEMRAIEELMSIDPSIFEVSLNNYFDFKNETISKFKIVN